MSLAALLIPLIPTLVQGILNVVNTIKSHADTPDAAKAQLDSISLQLEDLKNKVAAVKV
jgi:hypothetical protein